MSKPQSATAPAILILGGLAVSAVFNVFLGIALAGLGGILLVIRVIAGAANTINDRTKVCPYCAETIKAEAKVCRYCGRDLTTPAQATTQHEVPSEPVDKDKLMKQFGITFDGKRYRYRDFSYDRFEDAVNYAIRAQNRS